MFPDGFIVFEAFSPLAKPVSDFLVAIAEPVCRPELVHEFQITIFSLYAAVSIGLEIEDIVDTLQRLSKNELDVELMKTMKGIGSRVGKLKLVLQENHYMIESVDRGLLDQLQTSAKIKNARTNRQRLGPGGRPALAGLAAVDAQRAGEVSADAIDPDYHVTLASRFDSEKAAWKVTDHTKAATDGGISQVRQAVDGKGSGKGAEVHSKNRVKHDRVFSFEIDPKKIEEVKEAAYKMQLPLLEEYDFRRHSGERHPDLALSLRTTTAIRPYQEKSLSKIFSNGRLVVGSLCYRAARGRRVWGSQRRPPCTSVRWY